MLKKFVGGLVATLLCVGLVLAAEVKGKVKSYEKGSLVVVVDGKDKTYKVGKDVKLIKGSDEVTDKKEQGKFKKNLKDADVVIDVDGDTVKSIKVK